MKTRKTSTGADTHELRQPGVESNAQTAVARREEGGREVAETVNVPARMEETRMEEATTWTPLVDIFETNDGFLFQADLPGVKPGDLDVSFENGNLTLDARVAPPVGRNYVWREYGVGRFYRSFSLNAPVNADGIKAELKNGQLNLFVPKADYAKARKIEIQGA